MVKNYHLIILCKILSRAMLMTMLQQYIINFVMYKFIGKKELDGYSLNLYQYIMK